MKTKQFYNATLNTHGVDITTDKGERFGIACPDETTARQIAAGGEAIELLRATVAALNYQIENAENGLPYPSALIKAEKFLANLHAEQQ